MTAAMRNGVDWKTNEALIGQLATPALVACIARQPHHRPTSLPAA